MKGIDNFISGYQIKKAVGKRVMVNYLVLNTSVELFFKDVIYNDLKQIVT